MNLREELVDIYPKLFGFALKRTGNADTSEELVLETCKRILERETALGNDVNLTAYCIITIKNLIRDGGRFAQRWSDAEVPEIADRSGPGDKYEIRQAFNTLGEDCQKILEFFGMGHSYKEISELLEIRMGTVMSRMSRCRDQFQLAMEG